MYMHITSIVHYHKHRCNRTYTSTSSYSIIVPLCPSGRYSMNGDVGHHQEFPRLYSLLQPRGMDRLLSFETILPQLL